jgi:6-phosphofructokinase 2
MSIGVYMLKPNLNELAEMVGRELNTQKEQEDAALSLIETGKIDVLVVSLGPSGAMMVSKEGVYHVAAPSVRKRSTVGAGDSMVAGVVFSMARNWALHDSLRYGIACGTAATMNTGTGLCRKEDVEELFKWLKTK